MFRYLFEIFLCDFISKKRVSLFTQVPKVGDLLTVGVSMVVYIVS